MCVRVLQVRTEHLRGRCHQTIRVMYDEDSQEVAVDTEEREIHEGTASFIRVPSFVLSDEAEYYY